RGGTHQASDAAIVGVDQGRTEFQRAELRRTDRLDDLDTLTGDDQLPILVLSLRHVLAQGLHLRGLVLQQLLDQVLSQAELLQANTDHGRQVARTQGLEQIQEGTGLQELRGPASVWPEEQPLLAINHAGVEVRHGHRRSADGGLTVDLRAVLLDELLVGAAQPLNGDRAATVALHLAYAGLQQQRQRRAASPNEDDTGRDDGGAAGEAVHAGYLPLRAPALTVDDHTPLAHLEALGRQP